MSNKKIGFYFEDQLPNISTPLLDDFSFFYVKNEKSFNGEIVNIPKLFLYNKNINNFINLSGPDNYYVNSVNNIISNNGNIDLNLQNIVDKDNSLNKEIKFINGNYLYSKDDVSYFSNLSDTQINNFNNISNTILIGKNFGNINYELISNNNIFLGNNIKLPNNNISNNLILTNDLNISLNNYEVINNTFIGGYFYSENTEEFINQQIISGNIFIKGLGYGNIAENFKFNLPLTLSNNTKIIDNDNNNENDSLLYDNILVAKNNGLIGIKRINSFDFIPTLSQVLTKSGNSNTINVENINIENLKFNNYENNESNSLDNKIGYLIIDNTGKVLWKELENKPTLESVILENPNANTKPIFNEVEISNKLYVKNLTNKNNDILFDKLLIANSNGELAQISKNDLLSEKQNVLGYNPENSENKSLNVLADKTSSTKYPSVKALYDYIQPEFNNRLNGYAYDYISDFPTVVQTDALFIDRELGQLYIGWSDPNYFGDPALSSTYYKKIGLDVNTIDLVYYYKKTDSDLRYITIEANSSTGTEISFTNDRIYGSLASPETGNITADVTDAKLGVTNIIIHNSVTAPTFGTQFKKLSGSGNYVVGVVNYIYCTFISTTEIIYSINQRS